ncbi:MAG: hypothetical protein MPJ24_08965 [Pirellulaceae bacterium]|nr:hypothetical protein [Pirellulaceae bacterium]
MTRAEETESCLEVVFLESKKVKIGGREERRKRTGESRVKKSDGQREPEALKRGNSAVE